jgi:uncharacterized protein (UPF0276 family)
LEWSRFDLGVGIIALPGIDLIWDEIEELVDVIEVEPQTIWETLPSGGWKLSEASRQYVTELGRPILSHGVGFPVGGTVAPDPYGVALAAQSADELGALHWSEHLAFNRARQGDGLVHAGFLLPPVQTPHVVDAAIANIACYQAESDRPFLIETPTSYLRPVDGDLSDGEFLSQIVEAADCGILLDLHNIWANERNGRQSVMDFLSQIPLDRVWEVHLAGGYETGGFYLDAHCGAVSDELLEIARFAVPLLPRIRALVFEAVPESLVTMGGSEVRSVLDAMHDLRDLVPRDARVMTRDHDRGVVHPDGHGDLVSPSNASGRETDIAIFTTRSSTQLPNDDPGAEVLRFLTDQARLGLVTVSRPEALRELLEELGIDKTEELLAQFLSESSAEIWTTRAGSLFDAWLDSAGDALTQPLIPP